MRKLSFLLAILAICFFLIGGKSVDFVPENGVFLLTYPRSGTNWTVGILQVLCKRPVHFLENPDGTESLGVNRLGFEIDESLPAVYRKHTVTPSVLALDQSNISLIFTLRNFKECIIKSKSYTPDKFFKAVLHDKKAVSQYFENLRFFDSGWKNPKTKHMIIYEEILLNPQKEVVSLLSFLGEDIKKVPEFFEKHYDDWNQKMLESYHKQHAHVGPSSNGELIFHSKDFPKEILRQVDATIQARYPDLWEKYLKRYAEAED